MRAPRGIDGAEPGGPGEATKTSHPKMEGSPKGKIGKIHNRGKTESLDRGVDSGTLYVDARDEETSSKVERWRPEAAGTLARVMVPFKRDGSSSRRRRIFFFAKNPVL